MTTGTDQDPTLRDWGAAYAMDRDARDAEPDTAREVCERRIREAARAAGHEPVGRVLVTWHDQEPGVDPDSTPLDDRTRLTPSKRVWASVVVAVRPNGAAKAALHGCPRCGSTTTPAMVLTPQGPQIQVRCPRCDG